jgi:hypothetical protein
VILVVVITLFLAAITRFNRHLQLQKNGNQKIISFFHPNCDAGAGGEKVLWSAVAAV